MAVYRDGLTRLESLPEAVELLRNRAAIELGAAGVRYRQGRFEDALEFAELAGTRAEAADDRRRLAHAFRLMAVSYNELGRSDGVAYSERALAIYEALGDFAGMGHTLNNLGIGFYYAGRWDEAVASYRRGRDALERAGDVVGEATLANNEGEILSDQGRLDDAEAPFRHFGRVSGAAGYALGEGVAFNNLARLAARRGAFDGAHALFASAVAVFERIGSAAMLLEARAREVECLVFQGRHAEAIALLDSLEPGGGTEMTAILLERMRGFALCQARRPDEGRTHLEQSLALSRTVGSDYETALSLRALAETGGSGPEEAADETFARLGVVNLPHVPLP
jgi:tetratricopeptide (TPR) repeat protein